MLHSFNTTNLGAAFLNLDFSSFLKLSLVSKTREASMKVYKSLWAAVRGTAQNYYQLTLKEDHTEGMLSILEMKRIYELQPCYFLWRLVSDSLDIVSMNS